MLVQVLVDQMLEPPAKTTLVLVQVLVDKMVRKAGRVEGWAKQVGVPIIALAVRDRVDEREFQNWTPRENRKTAPGRKHITSRITSNVDFSNHLHH